MSVREKNVWVTTGITLLVYGLYCFAVLPSMSANRPQTHVIVEWLIGAVVALAVLYVSSAIVSATTSPRGDADALCDERDKRIELNGDRVGYAVLVIGAMLCCIFGLFIGAKNLALSNAILLAVVISALAKNSTQIVQYRLGA